MKPQDDSGTDLRRGRCAFQAAIVASATHEFQNHLAVIKEYSGLAGDLLRGARKKELPAVAERSSDITDNIINRARQAAVLVDALNQFAHRSDTELSTFRVADTVDELCRLLQRTAGRQEVSFVL